MTLVEFNFYFGKYEELAKKVCSYTDKPQKKTAIESLLGKIDELICDTISDNLQEIQNYTGFYFPNYVGRKYYGSGEEEIIALVDADIQEILLFENDSMEERRKREAKSALLRQTQLRRENVVKIIPRKVPLKNKNGTLCYDEEIRETDPDWIYSMYGTYTKYSKFKTHRYFPICLNIKKSGCSYFKTTNHFVLLYIALNNELQMLNEELELLGMLNAPEVETEQHKTETDNPQVDKEKLKEYFTPDIFQKKGTQKSKVDKFIELLGTGGSSRRVAQFAQFAYVHLLQDRYKHSLSWGKWLSIFYEITTKKTGYKYRQNEVSNPELEEQIKALFNHK
jgi:hypothetical protein